MIAVPRRNRATQEDWLSARKAEALWLGVAQRRLEQFRSGVVRGIPADEAFARARKALRARKS